MNRHIRNLFRFVFRNAMGRKVNAKSRQQTPSEYLEFQAEMDERERRAAEAAARKDSEWTPPLPPRRTR